MTEQEQKQGRPSKQTPEIVDKICVRLAEGESLRAICLDSDMPCRSTVFGWLQKDQAFLDQYTRAREAQADTLFDEILDIADDSSKDKRANEDGREVVDGEAIQRSRLRIDTRKWMAGKLRPKKYGERLDVNNTHDVSDPMKDFLSKVAETSTRLVKDDGSEQS